ncbi:IclR family transcriptional regulator [Celeribacter halophilus]|uniref:Transcriptional regulator, IclR family n=1 Tax=Celeribacter halophilus TaxID=576117 RepID=A0A1I3NST1_9RHOB|nr:IclR family transcriptional regulator [Celeribacter halophilus]PZX14629.1 IclR family transcriptional regulator [Celeribacter halophilus]SFJ12242.1 transcriptional regulator, IclR family [Celeribacter halophilus]
MAAPTSETTDPKTNAYDVPPVTRAINLLRYIAAGNRCRNTSKAASALGINRTTLIRLLHTLEREQMIESDHEGGGYILSYGLLELAANMLSGRNVVRLARPILSRLATEIGLSAHFGVLSGTEVIVLVRETPNVQIISNVHEGSRLPAHAAVMGRIILANMPREEVLALFADHPMSAVTSKTPTSLEDLNTQLDHDAREGLAWSVAFFEEGIGSCAAVVLDHSNTPVGAISVSGPQATFDLGADKRDQIAVAIRAAAKQLSSLMGHAG